MTKTVTLIKKGLSFNLKTLIQFEIIYRLFGVFLLFPILRLLFILSLRLNGITYLTNNGLIAYLKSPYTILVFLIVLLIFSLYILYEMLTLGELFKHSFTESFIPLKTLLLNGARRLHSAFKNNFFLLISRAFVFFILVEAIQLLGFFQNKSIPTLFQSIIELRIVQTGMNVALVIIFILFILSFYVTPIIEFEGLSSKKALMKSFKMIQSKPYKTLFGIISINLIINLIIFIVNALLLILIGGLVSILQGSIYVKSVLLSIIYSLYIGITFISSMFIIPIHFAYIFSDYIKKTNYEIPKESYKPSSFNKKRFILSLGLLSIIVPIINFQTFKNLIEQERSRVELFNRPLVIAHRGASNYAPENTLSAFEEAMKQNSDGIELDIRMTKDGVLVVFHDSIVSRTTNLKEHKTVESLTYEELSTLDAGSWFNPVYQGEKIPSLEEVFILTEGNQKLYLELKSIASPIEEKLFELIELYNLEDKVIIMSFNRTQLKTIKDLSENRIKTMLLLPVFYGDIMDVINSPTYDYFGLSVDILKSNSSYIDIIHQKEKRIYVWTTNSKEDIRLMSNLDVDGIITDDPLLALEIVLEDYRFSLIEMLLRLFE